MRTKNSDGAVRWAGFCALFFLVLAWAGSLAAAPAYQSKAEAVGTTTSLSINKPSGTVQNDLLLAAISARGGSNTTITPPTGWTEVLRDDYGTDEALAVFYRVAGASEGTNYTFVLNPSSSVVGAILRYTGVNTSVPIDVSSTSTGTTNVPIRAPAVVTTVDDTSVLRIAGTSDNRLTAVPGTERVRRNANLSSDVALGVGEGTQATAGNTGTADFTTSSSNDEWVTATVALSPAIATIEVCAVPGKDGSPTSLSGTVNTYYPGTSNASAGETSISVGTPTGDTSKSIASGDLLLVIQMQDAAINTSNSANYGGNNGTGSGATNYNSAGLYEFVRATGPVSGVFVPIQSTGTGLGLLNTYTNANATNTQGQRRFQVVRVPQYDSPTVTGQLNASAWNGSTGGIVAVDAAGTLTFSGGSINVNAQGFRGGLGQGLGGGSGSNSDHVSSRSVNNNGNKGEGVAGSPFNMYDGTGATTTGGGGYPTGSATTGDRARGAPGNAGGGGTDDDPANNDENSGGGGGGNGGSGGLGGYCWSNGSCPGRGIGGATFPHAAGRLALGGGGGSGARNNSSGVQSSGGVGGGIIIVRANSITGTATLSANGGVGVEPENDGGGGGGAGGSVLVFARTDVLNSLTINANGANGTNADPAGSAHGPGGGGAGGVIYLSSAAGSTSVSGGANGTTTTGLSAFGATPGTAGATGTITESQIPGVSPGATCKATLASVAEFGATVEGGQVVLHWETAFELGTAGFHLERLDPLLDGYERVNDELLPALITSPQGGRYSYLDPDAWPGQTYTYRLVEKEVWGGTRKHGPYRVTPAEQAPQMAPAALMRERQANASDQGYDDPGKGYRAVPHKRPGRHFARKAMKASAKATSRAGFDTGVVKTKAAGAAQVSVREDGLFYVGAAELAEALGTSENKVRRWLGKHRLKLTTAGNNVAWRPAVGNDGLLFYGEAIDNSLYTLDNVYRMRSRRKGETMETSPAEELAPDPVAADAFDDTVTLEQDLFAATVVSTDPERDYWYWEAFIGGSDPTWSTKQLTVHLPDVDDGGILHVFLKGAVVGAHPVSISINGHSLGKGTWSGLTDYELRLPVTGAQLQSGDNIVEISALDGSENIFYLDRLAMDYRRLAQAIDDRLTVNAEGDGPLAVDGFSADDVEVFDISDPNRPLHITATTVAPGAVGWGVTFNARQGRRYLALTGAAIAPSAPTPMTDADLGGSDEVDYLVIAPPALRDAAQALADDRWSKGLNSRVVGTDEIYDGFNWGIASPHAVRKFLRRAVRRWGVRYVVLVGKGSFDYRDLRGNDEPQAPTLMTSTPYGLFGCDNCLADFDGDGAPDAAIGRIPAASPEELDAYLAKVVAYESQAVVLEQAGALLLADKPDPAAGYFPQDSDWVAELLPAGMDLTSIYLDQQAIGAARSLLLDGMKQGTGWVNYLGHGGMDRFGGSQALLTVDDMAMLQSSGPLPVVSALTCAVNRFEFPGYAALGERLALYADGGAIAVWAPTGLSLNEPALQLNRSLFASVFEQWAPTLGEAVQQALQDNAGRAEVPAYMLRIYSLIGDPALQLRH